MTTMSSTQQMIKRLLTIDMRDMRLNAYQMSGVVMINGARESANGLRSSSGIFLDNIFSNLGAPKISEMVATKESCAPRSHNE